MNFAIIGVGGYIAPRHLEAIKDLGHNLVAAYDKNDSVGIMDRYFPDCQFFTEFERFEAYVESLKKTSNEIHYVSICTPNYLHSSHIKFALRHNAHAICEKPIVLTTSELDELLTYEKTYNKNVFTVLQLRVHEAILNLKKKVETEKRSDYKIHLNYITSRGQWYHESWKGDPRKSGGLSTNIGVHFFDMLTWIFGPCLSSTLGSKTLDFEEGFLTLEKASVQWSLTIDRQRLPPETAQAGKTTFRSITIDGSELEFSEGFTDLHKKIYTDVLSGNGYSLLDARPAIEIVQKIRESK